MTLLVWWFVQYEAALMKGGNVATLMMRVLDNIRRVLLCNHGVRKSGVTVETDRRGRSERWVSYSRQAGFEILLFDGADDDDCDGRVGHWFCFRIGRSYHINLLARSTEQSNRNLHPPVLSCIASTIVRSFAPTVSGLARLIQETHNPLANFYKSRGPWATTCINRFEISSLPSFT